MVLRPPHRTVASARQLSGRTFVAQVAPFFCIRHVFVFLVGYCYINAVCVCLFVFAIFPLSTAFFEQLAHNLSHTVSALSLFCFRLRLHPSSRIHTPPSLPSAPHVLLRFLDPLPTRIGTNRTATVGVTTWRCPSERR